MNLTCVPRYVADDIERVSKQYNIPAAKLAGQMNLESAFNPKAISGAGAQGCAQYMPSTWNSYVRVGAIPPDWDVWNCETAVEAMAIYLKRNGVDQDWRAALRAYVSGKKDMKYDWYPAQALALANEYSKG